MAWDEVKARLAAARTPQEKLEAVKALVSHIPEQHLDKHLVIMQKGGVHAIPLYMLHLAMQDSSTFDLVKKVISGGRQ